MTVLCKQAARRTRSQTKTKAKTTAAAGTKTEGILIKGLTIINQAKIIMHEVTKTAAMAAAVAVTALIKATHHRHRTIHQEGTEPQAAAAVAAVEVIIPAAIEMPLAATAPTTTLLCAIAVPIRLPIPVVHSHQVDRHYRAVVAQ